MKRNYDDDDLDGSDLTSRVKKMTMEDQLPQLPQPRQQSPKREREHQQQDHQLQDQLLQQEDEHQHQHDQQHALLNQIRWTSPSVWRQIIDRTQKANPLLLRVFLTNAGVQSQGTFFSNLQHLFNIVNYQ